jgi:membrane protein implicated in regulation of membrane protease activity
MDVLWWVGAALAFIVVEIVSVNLVLIMFAGGAFAAALANVLGANPGVQFVVFALVSGLLLFALRPWLLRRLRSRMPLVETNAAAQVGRVAAVVAEVSPSGGRIKLAGEVWSARTARDGLIFPAGTEVRVIRIDGATAVVDGSVPPPRPAAPGIPEHKESA